MKNVKIVSAIISISFLILSCSKSSSDTMNNNITCDGSVKTFATDVNPLIQTFCNQPSCHASGSINGPGPLTNYAQVVNAKSAIRSAVSSGFMPQNATLTVAQKSAIICWIDNGAPNN